MKKLLINQLQREVEEGVFATQHVFQLEGEEETHSSATVTFKLYNTLNKLIRRDEADASKVLAESIYFEPGDIKKGSTIADSAGGNACGRTFPSQIDDFYDKSDEEQASFRAEQKKIAGWYTFAFGEVTFPGKKPVVVNLRLTGRLSMPFGKMVDTLGRDKTNWPSNLIEIKAKSLKGKTQFSDLTFDIKQTGLAPDEGNEVIQEITNYVNDHNDNILTKQKAA